MPLIQQPDPAEERRLAPLLKRLWDSALERHTEGLLTLVVLIAVGAISVFVDDKLAFLDFFYLPVLMAGYLLGLRGAVLGSALSILWVGFCVAIYPDAFQAEPSPMGLYLRLVAWGGFLILSGVLVGRLNEEVVEKIARLKAFLEQWRQVQGQLDKAHQGLEDKNQALEALRTKFESVLYSSMDAVTAQLAAQDKLTNERREVTALMADFAEFASSAGKMDPGAAVKELNGVLTQMEPIISAYHGHLDRFAGPGLVAEFGMPTPAAQSPLLGVLAALKMQQKAGRRRDSWKMRVGIAHGPALVGLVGSDSRKSYTAIGEAVEAAARLNARCPPGGVVVSSAIHEKVEGAFLTRRLFGQELPELGDHQEKLGVIEKRITSGTAALEDYLEAGRRWDEAGDAERAYTYYEKALGLDPPARPDVERRITDLKAQTAVLGRGQAQASAVYEILALKDPLEDEARLPARIAAVAAPLFMAEGLNREMLLPLEALKGFLGHSQVTAALSAALASAMGHDEAGVRAAFLAGFFHEIGLRTLSPDLADKDESMPNLGRAELAALRSHPEGAQAALADLGLDLSKAALEAIKQHLENVDGSGPQRLPGAAIAPLARVVRIAHEYDRLTSWRPYRQAWTRTAALSSLRLDAEANQRLDPKILRVFERLLSPAPGAGR